MRKKFGLLHKRETTASYWSKFHTKSRKKRKIFFCASVTKFQHQQHLQQSKTDLSKETKKSF